MPLAVRELAKRAFLLTMSMTMDINCLGRLRINAFPICCFIACFGVTTMGCANGGNAEDYRESDGRVAKFTVKQSDAYLRIATFLKLKNGGLQDPKVYYYQGHYTAAGVRSVEKPGRLFSVTMQESPDLYLPKSDEIERYLLLVCEPIIKELQREDGSKKKVTEWTDWFLLEVPTSKVTAEEAIVIPPFDELTKRADDQRGLLKELRSMYAKAEAAAEKKMNTPIKSRSEVPWYAR